MSHICGAKGGGGDAKLALADGVTQKDGGTTPRTSMRNKIKMGCDSMGNSAVHCTCDVHDVVYKLVLRMYTKKSLTTINYSKTI